MEQKSCDPMPLQLHVLSVHTALGGQLTALHHIMLYMLSLQACPHAYGLGNQHEDDWEAISLSSNLSSKSLCSIIKSCMHHFRWDSPKKAL